MRIVFFGTPAFSVPALQSLLHAGHEVAAVVTQPDRQSGRGRKVIFSPVKQEAIEHDIRVMQPLKVRDPEFINELKSLDPVVIVVVAYGQILPPDIIHLPKHGCINIHASLLPHYRGAAPINWVIINGEEKTGVTTMMMDEGMDTGPALLKSETEIGPHDTAGILSERLSRMGAELLIPTIEGIVNGSIKPEPQSGEASYAPIMKKTDGRIDWTWSADRICSLVRGMNPWPGAYGYVGEDRYKIAMAESIAEDVEAGLIYRVTKDELCVGAGKGAVTVKEIQPSGKPVMPVKAFLQGRKLQEGMRFETSDE